MVVLSDGETLKITDVPEHILKPKSDLNDVRIDLPSDGIRLEEIEREIIRRALQMNDWNQSKTARYLGITRSALIYRMRKFGLDKAD
jgi:two-component system NtrC family response regulator